MEYLYTLHDNGIDYFAYPIASSSTEALIIDFGPGILKANRRGDRTCSVYPFSSEEDAKEACPRTGNVADILAQEQYASAEKSFPRCAAAAG